MGKYIARLQARIALNHRAFVVYSILRILVILTGVRCILTKNYESLFLCILSLILFLLPSFFEEKLKVNIPAVFQIMIYVFIYAAEILGEVNKYYTAIPGWDTMLHTINGFLCGAIGLSLVYILNRHRKGKIHLSPFYLAMMAFCFSMTVGVLWEFVEYSADRFFYFDMQKDFVISEIGSVSLDETNSQIPVHVSGIERTIIETKDGKNYVIEGGYLDIGINDTMKDLLVNFLGALVFSMIGYFYERTQNEKSLAAGLMITPLSDREMEETNEMIRHKLEDKVKKRPNREK